MDEMTPVRIVQQRWSLDSLDWNAVRDAHADDMDDFFYLLAAASFMEITTDRYAQNLIEKFSDDAEVTMWLRDHWMPEEMQHGEALRRYVRIAWPEFDWDRIYAAFIDEFAAYCAVDKLEPSRSREMASRCVVEMGTAGFYTTLSRMSPEPVLAKLASWIAEDEIRHYKYFYRYFRRYRKLEQPSRWDILMTFWSRLRMIDGEDNVIALKHLYAERNSGAILDRRTYKQIRRGPRALIRRCFPHRMCVQMLLRPLGLGRRTQKIAVPIVMAVARRLVP